MSSKHRWLSENDQKVWRTYLRATQEVQTKLDKDLADSGLSLNEYEVLVVLSEQPDRTIRMSALAEDLVNSRSRLTHTVNRLERRGFVQREACANDGRGVNCLLTDEGFAFLADVAPIHVESVRTHIFDRLTPEQAATMGEILGQLIDD